MTGVVAAAATDSPTSPAAYVLGFIVLGGLLAVGVTVNVIRFRKSRKPREHQMAILAARLDGRRQVYVRFDEVGLDQGDLLRVGYSRGYGLIEHKVGKYYEFVYAPNQAQPGRPGPWAI
ncbi:hypothetical protein MUY14_38935 [Amycolatopsis sp. FBCC-B4732]|uniref:hypothetical protein n=1 Tax=Amycolatopsis sp. FBCC-B4732 TaxID=3079339 RepID=UPI001FF191E9|nr:hypothetical protein [Amycolatopsis sp. FBCC-B4732]UOX87640.1 hypothetical protein MUY14_38935 [Amycolatopsis sp. FBCC-B4732]